MRRITAIAIGFATISLAALYALAGLWVWVTAILLLGLLWLVQSWRGQDWTSTVGLLSFSLAVVLGAFFGFSSPWLLTCLVAILIAWDLDHLTAQFRGVTNVQNEASLKRHHCVRLGVVASMGWLLGIAALNVRLNFGFSVTLALGLIVIISLSGTVRFIRREREQE